MRDAQTANNTFSTTFDKIYNQCFPIKTIKITHNNRLPWLTHGLQISIKTKNKLYYTFHKKLTQLKEKRYKKFRNKLNHLLRISEKQHIQQLFEENKNDLRRIWATIKQIINKNRHRED